MLPASPSSRGALWGFGGGFSDGSWGVSGRRIPLGPLGSDWKKLVVLKDAESCFLSPHSPTPPCAAERFFYSTLNHKPAHSTLFWGGCFFCNSLNTHCLHSANFQSNNIKVRLQVRGPTKVLKTRPALHPASRETPPEPPPTPQPPPPPRGQHPRTRGVGGGEGGKGPFGSPDTGTSLRKTKIDLNLYRFKKITSEPTRCLSGGGSWWRQRPSETACWSKHRNLCLFPSAFLSSDYLEANVRRRPCSPNTLLPHCTLFVPAPAPAVGLRTVAGSEKSVFFVFGAVFLLFLGSFSSLLLRGPCHPPRGLFCLPLAGKVVHRHRPPPMILRSQQTISGC